MQLAPLVSRAALVPVRHLSLAVCLAAALGSGFWLWSRLLPVAYVSSALLSYETPHNFLADTSTPESDVPTVDIAETILSPAMLVKTADQVQVESGQTVNGAAPTSGVDNARAEDFRAHLDLVQPAPGLLQVTYRGTDVKDVLAATNAVASALAAWTPKPVKTPADSPAGMSSPVRPPDPGLTRHSDTTVHSDTTGHAAPTPIQSATGGLGGGPVQGSRSSAAQLQHRAAMLKENVATLVLQQQGIDRRIAGLVAEEKSLEGSLSPFPTDAATEADRSRLATVVKQLGPLRLMRGTLATEQESERKQAQELTSEASAVLNGHQTSLPAAVTPPPAPAAISRDDQASSAAAAPPQNVHPADADRSSTKQPTWQGTFTVVAWGEKPLALGDERKRLLICVGAASAIALASIYLSLAAWRFRPVSDLASLRKVLPGDVKYFGAVSGSPIVEKSS
jgi:hypothetical protein